MKKTIHVGSATITIENNSITSDLVKSGNATRKEATVIEWLVLSHHCEGIDVTSAPYKAGLYTTLETLANA